MFSGLKNIFSSLYQKITSTLSSLLAQEQVDEQTIREIEKILLEADCGVNVSKKIVSSLRDAYQQGVLKSGQDAKKILKTQLFSLLSQSPQASTCEVYLLVGVNGSGKTTALGKLAALFKKEGKKVLMIAADTFRAAATEQLTVWAQRTGVDIIVGAPSQDPASVVYRGCQKFKDEAYDVLLIDTAGRLQTKINLMKELEKIKRTILKVLPDRKESTLLTIDALLGQNSLEQARLFHESSALDGIILTKMDGTAKGGIIFAISDEFKIPVVFVSYGEKPEQLKPFDPQQYVDLLIQ